MDSCPKKGDGRLMFKATKPHFFKIILDDTIRSRKLGIPRRFVRRYGSELSSPVFLKVPSGAKWQVQLVKCNGEIWLENGWQEFVEYYSLVFGYFLIFEFEQNCHFNVFVFDKSASEIDYPFNITNAYDEEPNLEEECPDPEIEETENDVGVEILGYSLRSPKTKAKSPLPFPQPHKKIKLENPTENTKSHWPTGQSEAKRSKEGMSNEKRSLDGVAGRKQPLTAEEKANALHNAGTKFKSGNPYFMIAMQPSYLHRLRIPASFMRDYFNKNSGSVALITEDGETWSVDFSYTLCNGRASATLRHGWKKFVEENHLEVGDVCVFELINRIAIRFKVGIFRHIKDANSSLSLDAGTSKQLKDEESSCCRQFNPGNSCSKAFGAIEAAKKFTSVNPFFKVIINSCYLENSLVYVPLNLVAKSTKQGTNKVMLQVENRRWSVKLFRYPAKAMISDGWRSFARENSLKVGDVCIFELITNEAELLKVTIFRNVNFFLCSTFLSTLISSRSMRASPYS
ncbi:B3 domain-containing transcription factor VRN1 [Hevea brasiliensis]|uniref:B3 domain-containing transcription factor VRN1 n=1 Tax=Hevea brasiliensis TaxID=3981 RepID=UPI0025E54BC9|nr:B3 domain-containing transcription factor VRN1 [Hevea brasiliensis]